VCIPYRPHCWSWRSGLADVIHLFLFLILILLTFARIWLPKSGPADLGNVAGGGLLLKSSFGR
jgi:hypothetical protein